MLVVCLLLALLGPTELNCSTHWQLPRLAESSPVPSRLLRRDVIRLITVSKTSREAVHYGLLWVSWKHTHNKTYYGSNEALERYVVWRSNTAYILSHNTYADKFGFTMEMNAFGDLVGAILNVTESRK